MYAMMELPLGPLIARSTMPIARNAARRRSRFTDREAAINALTGRGVFKSFTPEMIADYVADGLVEDPKGGFKLSCTPAYESATFAAQRHNPWAALRNVSCPQVVLKAELHSTISPASLHHWAALKPDALIATVEGATHMLPMERPDRVRSAIESAALKVRMRRPDLD
jgi:pimeloyl-ACP methyl ester carboxylesterase